MSAQPGRALSFCWEQQRKLLPGVAGVHAAAVERWSVQQVSSFSFAPCSFILSICYRPVFCFFFQAIFHFTMSAILQVSDFIESLPGCENQAKQFQDEVRHPPTWRLYNMTTLLR